MTFESLIKLFSDYHVLATILVGIAVIFLMNMKYFKSANHHIASCEVSEIWIYPVKSCKGIKLRNCRLYKRGFVYDRIFMVVDEYNNMLTQRIEPKMALIATAILEREDLLALSGTGMKDITVQLSEPQVGELKVVTVWGEEVEAIDMGDDVATWLSTFLGISKLRLCRICDNFVRKCDTNFAPKGQTSFTDGFSFLLASNESLDSLNALLEKPISLTHFRPNIIVKGGKPFDEDKWKAVQVGAVTMKVVKPCSRCKIPTIDPNSGVFDKNNQPTKALQSFRTAGKLGLNDFPATDVFFGQNLDHGGLEGPSINLGDKVFVLSRKE